jgi:hypothetical protein
VTPIRVPDDEELPSADAVSSEPAAVPLGYAISEYLDVEDTMRRLKALVAQPVRGLRHDALLDVLNYFETKCRSSKEITDRAKGRIPGGVQHNLAFNYPFPLAIDRAEGAYLTDRDGNTYIDFLQAGGPTILGSNYGPVNERVAEVIRASGPVTGLFHEYELKLAEIINLYMPHVEMYRSLGSGTEAVMAAVRGARAFTGKKMVIKVGGAYHGWSDTMVYGLRVPGSYRMNAKGIPFGATGRTRETFPHDLGALKRKLIENRLRGGTAAVIVEPVGPESGTRPVPRDFNAKVRALCDEFGALLIFDEVVTGFRLGMGGAAGYFGVTPDLTVLGKACRAATRWPAASADGPTSWRSSAPGSTARAAPTSRSAARCRRTRCRARPATSRSRRWPAPTRPSSRDGPATAHPRPAAPHRQVRPAVRGLQPGLDRPPGVQRRDAARHAQPPQAAQGEQGRARS